MFGLALLNPDFGILAEFWVLVGLAMRILGLGFGNYGFVRKCGEI